MVDWPVVQGDDWSSRFQLKVGGVPIADFTGYTLLGQVRRGSKKTSPLVADIDFDLTEGNGYVTMEVRRNLTQNVDPEECKYEVEWIRPNDRLRTMFGGSLTVSPQVALAPDLVIP